MHVFCLFPISFNKGDFGKQTIATLLAGATAAANFESANAAKLQVSSTASVREERERERELEREGMSWLTLLVVLLLLCCCCWCYKLQACCALGIAMVVPSLQL